MKKKILTLLICILMYSTISAVTTAVGQKTNNKEEMNDILIMNKNNPPNPPEIDGPKSGLVKETHIYYFKVTDPDEDDKLLTLEIEWGDGLQTETCGCDIPWDNGEIVEVEHRWKDPGNYKITARVADVYNYWSEWSDPYTVSMPKNEVINSSFILRLYEYFPFLACILKI